MQWSRARRAGRRNAIEHAGPKMQWSRARRAGRRNAIEHEVVESARRTLGSPPDRKGGDDGGTRRRDFGRRHPRRHPDPRPVRRDRRPGVDAAPGRGGGRRRRRRTTEWRDQPFHRRPPHLAAQQAQRRARPRAAGRPGPARRPARGRGRAGAQPRSDACARARPRRCRTGRAPPATGGLVGAVVAGQPPRRRSPGERAPGLGAPRRPRRAAGLPGRPDLPPLPDRQLVRRTPQRDRHPRPPDRTPAHRTRRAGAHQHRPGCTGADGDALATRGTALTVPGDGHAEGADRGFAVRIRRRRLVAPDG